MAASGMSRLAAAYVKRPCCCFWSLLLFYLLLSFLGAASLLRRAQNAGQTSVFSDGTEYDWSVSGRVSVENSDKVRTAWDVANSDADLPSSRRRLLEEDGEVRGSVDVQRFSAGEASVRALASRALSESGSGEDDGDDPERSRTASGRFSTLFLYFAKEGVDDILTPPILKQMCEVENAVLGGDDYGKVCYNSSAISSSTYTTGADGNQCTLPTISIVSLFYTLWDDSVHDVALVRAAMAKVKAATTQIAAIVGGTTNLQAWWSTGSNAATITSLQALVTAASTAAASLNPGGSYASAYSGVISGVDAFAANLPGAGGFAVVGGPSNPTVTGQPSTPSLYALLENLDMILGFTGNLDDNALGMAILFNAIPFHGLPPNAPIKGTDTFTVANAHTRDCVLLDADYVAARKQQMFDFAHGSATMANAVGFFISADSLATNKTIASRGIIDFGRPRLAPYASNADFEDLYIKGYLEQSLWDFFGMKPAFMKSAYRDPATTADLTIKYSQSILAGREFGTIVNGDFIMVIFSFAFVFLYICFHTGSFPIGCFAVLQIMLSVPLALFVYVPILNVPFFGQVHILGIFIILGVGADDVFVYMDAWRQSVATGQMLTLKDRVESTYERTIYTVFNTSFTTAIAFFACASASIMPIAAFGVFSALAIIFNWVLTVTWWPAAVLVWELYFCRAKGIGCCFSCEGCCNSPCFIKDQTSSPATDPNARRSSVMGKEQPEGMAAAEAKLSCVERFFNNQYANSVNWSVGPTLCFGMRFKPFSYFLVLFLGVFGAYLAAEAVTLTTPDQAPVWFPGDHMITGLGDQIRETFLAGEDDEYLDGSLYFGIAGVDAPFYDKWKPAENRGTVVFDDNFNLSVPEAQSKFIQMCADLVLEDCIKAGEVAPLPVCTRSPYMLLSPNTIECFLKDWQDELAAKSPPEALPTGAGFDEALHAWLETEAGSDHWNKVGFVNGTVRFARVSFRWSAQRGIPVAMMRQIYDRTVAFLDAKYVPIPALGTPFVHNGGFSWMETSEELVLVVLQGFAVIFPCAFVILLISNGSLITSAYAILTLVLVTGSLLGGVKLAFGFALGIKEAIAGNIVIGLSIDYTLHLSHSYMSSSSETREGKVLDAATSMAVTVVAGFTTTFGAAMFMSPCQLTFFTDMVILLGGTVIFSIIYGLFFFMPLMAIAGPRGKSRSLYGHAVHCFCPDREEGTTTAGKEAVAPGMARAVSGEM